MATHRIFKTVCCVCHRQKGKNGWERKTTLPCTNVSHGYCPECYRKMMIRYGLASTFERFPELQGSGAAG
ncbi:MAG: hypothetical protein M0017_11930 [Desulfobacteraceae bacterium]|nr:hypothetical protein [Desulfobacteraceae bacterium]